MLKQSEIAVINSRSSESSRPTESYLDMDPVKPRFRANRHSLSGFISSRYNKRDYQSTDENNEEGSGLSTPRPLRRRLSGMFSISTILEAKKGAKHDPNIRPTSASDEHLRYRQTLYESLELGQDLYLMNGPEDMIEVVSSDKQHVLYKTSLPASFTLKHRDKLSHVTISSMVGSRPVATISKPAGELALDIRGLQTIRFHRGRPDCLFPVECFTLKQSTDFRRSFVRNDDRAVNLPPGDSDLSFSYAWKNTAMVGRGGLKLVDLRDSEVLAYYEPTLGKYVAKIHLQGSGLKLVKIVVATILALKARPLLRETDFQDHRSFHPRRGGDLTTCIEEAPEYDTQTS